MVPSQTRFTQDLCCRVRLRTTAPRLFIMLLTISAGACNSAGSMGGPILEGPSVTLVGAGDIADCDSDGDEATAALLDAIPGPVFTAGDNAYESGTAQEYATCYGPSWGRHKDRTRPTIGNHDFRTNDGGPYYDYFAANAGPAGLGYYSYDLGAWHVVALNSNVDRDPGSPQLDWLSADLAANPASCTIALWHHPRFSSGDHGNDGSMGAFWDVLYDAGVDVVVNGHDHNYERFAPQSPAGSPDPQRGIREFVVGTGGKSLRSVGSPEANSEVRNDDTHGVLELTLYDSGYAWEFIPIAGQSFRDSGSGACH